LKDLPKDADLNARRAEVLYLRGRWDDAVKAAEQALAARADHFLGRWVRAQVYRDRGDIAKAAKELDWFLDTYSARSEAGKDITDSEELILVALAGLEWGRWHPKEAQFQFILKEILNHVAKEDKDYWQAKYQAGVLFLEKYRQGDAFKAFTAALKINPQAAEVF